MTDELNENGTKRKRAPKSKPEEKPTPEQMAEAGDIDGLFALLGTSSWLMPNLANLLYRAIEVSVQRDRVEFTDRMFQKMIALSSFLVLAHAYVGTLAANLSDKRERYRDELKQVTEELLPRLQALQNNVAELMFKHASTMRQWALTKEREHRNDARRIPPLQVNPPSGTANGKASWPPAGPDGSPQDEPSPLVIDAGSIAGVGVAAAQAQHAERPLPRHNGETGDGSQFRADGFSRTTMEQASSQDRQSSPSPGEAGEHCLTPGSRTAELDAAFYRPRP